MSLRLDRRWVLPLVLVLATSRTATAAEGEELISQGLKLRKENKDQDALPLFRRAYEQQPSPRAAGQLGTCEQALGLWVGAETHIAEALKHPEDAWVGKNEALLRSALAYVQQRLGAIEVWGSPAGARVLVDGEFAGTLPTSQRARVAVGQRLITVEAPAFLSESRRVEVVTGAMVREHVVLRPVPTISPGVAAVVPTAGSSSVEATPLPLGPTAETHETGERPLYKKWWFWAIVGTVAAGIGGTVILLTTREDGCQAQMGGTCTTF